MTPEQEYQIRQLIRNELQELLASDRYIFHKLIQILDGRNIQVGNTTGTKIATATTQKLGFHNATPVIQRTNANQAAVDTTGATNTTPFGYTTAAQANGIITLLNELRSALVEKGIIKGS